MRFHFDAVESGDQALIRAGVEYASMYLGRASGVQVREFYPSRDKADVFCLWEGNSLEEVRDYVDATLGDASRNAYFEVDAEIARGLPELASSRA